MKLIIKKAVEIDVEALFNAHIDCWRETYTEYFSESVFKKREEGKKERVEHIKNRIKKGNPYYLLMDGINVVGLMILSVNTTNKSGMIDAIYIKKAYQRNGYGKELMTMAIHYFDAINYKPVYVACLKGLDSNQFFEKMNGTKIEDSLITISNQDFVEHNYVFLGEKI